MSNIQEQLDEILETISELSEIPDTDEAIETMANEAAFLSESISIRERIWSCKSCTLVRSCKKPVPFAGISAQPTLIALGEAPGREEDEQNSGFVGRSGLILRGSAKKVGVDISDYLNCCCCRPPQNRTPTHPEVDACAGNLDSQIYHLSPWMVLCFGATAIYAATGNPRLKITRDHGVFFKSRWVDPTGAPIWGYSFFHPSYTMRANDDLKKIDPKDGPEARRKIEQAKLICRKWGEDWERLGYTTRLKEMFRASLISAPHDDLASLSWVMNQAHKESPYYPGEEEKTKVARQTYLQKMDAMQYDLAVDEIPF